MDEGPHSALLKRYGFSFPVISLDCVDSTNRYLQKMASEDAPHGTTVFARQQSSGRGRLGREWSTPSGVNLLMSTLLRPTIPAHQVPLICLGAAVAICRACNDRVRIKWPNDIMSPGGLKIGGILAEAEFRNRVVDHLVVGIGINVSAAPEGIPATSCLADLGFDTGTSAVLGLDIVRELIAVSADLESSPELVLDEWRQRSLTLGARVEINGITGEAVGLAVTGALIIRDDSGQEHSVLAGDVNMVSISNGRY